jgi:hypothetical protein
VARILTAGAFVAAITLMMTAETAAADMSMPMPAPAADAAKPAVPPGPPLDKAMVLVKGPHGDTATIGETDLRSMHRYAVYAPWGGGHTYAGAAMSDILAEIGAPSEARLHGPPLDQVLVVTGRDGFIAVLAIGETAISLKGQPVILADEMDGKPLDEKEGAFRLVIGGELKPPRSVWGVTQIELRAIK